MMLRAENIFRRIYYKQVIALSILAILTGIGFAGLMLPKIIIQVMKMQLRVTPGTMTRSIFEVIPFALDFRVYMFNITNPDEVTTGAKPILQEIGPYYFEEWKDKINIEDNSEDDTMEYDYRATFIHKPEKGAPGLTGDEFVTVMHPLVLAMALSINIDRPELIPFIKAALSGLLPNQKDIFFRGRLWDLLYDVIVLDCSSDEFEVTAVCSEFSTGDYAEIKPINSTAYSFKLFGNANHSSQGRFRVHRGKKNILDLGNVLEYNGLTEMDAWYEDECNVIKGTDGTIFPPFHTKDEGYTVFSPQMCRALVTDYQKPSKVEGIKTNHFTLSFDVTKYGSPNCYCREGEDCPPKGILDLFPCSGAPVAISLPHFLDVDPDVLDKVEGLNPNREIHDFVMDFYQLAGAPIEAAVRAQVSFQVVLIEDIDFMKDLQEMYLPFFWFQESVTMPKKFRNMLKYQLILGLKLQKVMKYGCTLAGFAGLVLGAIACYMQLNDDNSEPRSSSATSDTVLSNPMVKSIEVTSNE